MTLDEVRACLERDGWPVEALGPTALRSRFRRGAHVFPLLVHVDAEHITFAIIPYARLPEEVDDAEPLVTRLLRLNREINMAKFSVDEDGDVVLSVEYRLANLDPSEVRDAVDVLSFYGDKHGAEIGRLASP